jgi:hypothetical protein
LELKYNFYVIALQIVKGITVDEATEKKLKKALQAASEDQLLEKLKSRWRAPSSTDQPTQKVANKVHSSRINSLTSRKSKTFLFVAFHEKLQWKYFHFFPCWICFDWEKYPEESMS